MAFFLAPLLAKLTASTIGKAVVGGAVSAIASNIGRKTTKPYIDLVGMRNDAQKAGFNPLTVMRSGGMSGYMVPAMSKQSFAGQMLGGALTAGFDAWHNKDIDDYNAQVRKLEIEQRKADLSISRATLGQLYAPKGQVNIPSPGQKIGSGPSGITTTVLPNTGAAIAKETLDALGVRQDAKGNYVSDRGEGVVKTYTGPSGRVYHVPSSGLEWDDVVLSGLLLANDLGWQAWDYATEKAKEMKPLLSADFWKKLNWTNSPSGIVRN